MLGEIISRRIFHQNIFFLNVTWNDLGLQNDLPGVVELMFTQNQRGRFKAMPTLLFVAAY